MFYLGVYGTAASRDAYDRLISEWIAAGRKLWVNPNEIIVNEVVASFRRYAQTYYRDADGSISTEARNYDQASNRW
jgi:hypothetical protein